MRTFKPNPASSTGLITNYKCSFKCRHCLYCSSPDISEKLNEDTIFRIIDEIYNVIPNAPMHIGGGESFLHFDLIQRMIKRISEKGMILEYVETNGLFLQNDSLTKLAKLKEAGLSCMLLSISPFHNEFISVKNTKKAFDDIVSTFGYEGIFPWHPGYIPYLESKSSNSPVNMNDYLKGFNDYEILHQLESLMYIHPAGRAAYLLSDYKKHYPPERFFLFDCIEHLTSEVHAHIDYEGNYLTGFCNGIRIGEKTAFNLNNLYNNGINLDQYPILDLLLNGKLKSLYEFAFSKGFLPDEKGYISPCHLCQNIRIFLYFNDKKYPELYPDFFYEELKSYV